MLLFVQIRLCTLVNSEEKTRSFLQEAPQADVAAAFKASNRFPQNVLEFRASTSREADRSQAPFSWNSDVTGRPSDRDQNKTRNQNTTRDYYADVRL